MINQQTLLWIALVQRLEFGTPARSEFDPSAIPADWLLHQGDNRGRNSANHNLLPDMHLHVPVLRAKTCRDSRLV